MDARPHSELRERALTWLRGRRSDDGETEDIINGLLEQFETAERWLRFEWWCNHGHPFEALYGDDQEMQCGMCPMDFKREPLSDLHLHVITSRAVAASSPASGGVDKDGHAHYEPRWNLREIELWLDALGFLPTQKAPLLTALSSGASRGNRPRLLDLFCGAGGAAMGYHRAGFEVVGVDIKPQPRYPFEFDQADALEVLADYSYLKRTFDAIHASPPCQFYAGLSRGDHWRSIPPTRELLEATGLPYVIENIADARWDMRDPIRLCGSTFGLHVRRHRMFETTFPMLVHECQHEAQGEIRAYYGKPGWAAWTPKAAVVNGGDRKPLLRGSVEQAADDMGIDWMDWDELREAIPPAYTEFIGTQLMAHLEATVAA